MSRLGAGVFTPEGFADALVQFGKEIERPIKNTIRRGLHRARNRAGADFRTRGIGHSIWGGHVTKGGKVAVRAYFKRTGVKKRGDVFVGGLWATGLPALQEVGGRTKAHLIRPTRAKRLVWATPEGIFSAAQVHHPGGKLPAYPVLKRAIEAEAPAIHVELGVEIQKLVAEKGMA